MTNITDGEINNIVRAINKGLDMAYFCPATYPFDMARMPRKELAHESTEDLQQVIELLAEEQNSKAVKRLKKYKEITDLLCEIPGELFIHEKEFTKALRSLTFEYSRKFQEVAVGNNYSLIEAKYEVIAKKAELEHKIEGMSAMENGGTDDLKKLVEVGNKYIELAKI